MTASWPLQTSHDVPAIGDADVHVPNENVPNENGPDQNVPDDDPVETAEWLESLELVLQEKGPQRAGELLELLAEKARSFGIKVPVTTKTPYINTIPPERQPPYPGDLDIEARIENIIRWNAMAMVVRANREFPGIGGHISTYASAATLLEVAFNHFLRGRGDGGGDQIYFQAHSSPGIYARAFLEGRLSETHLQNFRRENQPEGGLSSYPHPWLMPNFWELPTASMGLAPIMAIAQARFNRYLHDRGIKNTQTSRVWAFLGDGELDEPESLGSISLAAREQLDNLTFVVNCNLQRLDGPVRGNGKIIQELESLFHGAGWNVVKVIWSGGWDPLLADDEKGLLRLRMEEVVDGQFQKYTTMPGSYVRSHFFGKSPELIELLRKHSDGDGVRILRGGHDREKIYAAYQAAVLCQGKPSVVLAKTIKGYGLGETSEGRNITHQQKKFNEQTLRALRDRWNLPISDEDVAKTPFYKPPQHSVEVRYLHKRRQALGGYVPSRPTGRPKTVVPTLDKYREFLAGSKGKEISTTMGFVRLLTKLCRDRNIGKSIVPIVPDESRTFGMEGMFRHFGIYSHQGQLYEPVDANHLMYYREAVDGQILEEGMTEAGSMSSFIAAGTAYCQHGINMIPFFVFYSMFGFQRIGDLIWAAADARAKGFLIGGTAGRTTLNGEGLQHQDGQSLLNAIAFPTVRAYDPAYVYETAVIIMDGLKKLYQEGETAIYYLNVENENYVMPEMPDDVEEGIIRGLYKLSIRDVGARRPTVQLFGSGAILRQALRAQEILADRCDVSSVVWSVTSYHQLRRDAQACRRWNMLHPTESLRRSHLEQMIEGHPGPFIAATDYVRAVPEQLSPYVPGGIFALGTDGMGRSETRETLRRHFEVDAECITAAALYRLCELDKLQAKQVQQAIEDLGIDPEKVDPLTA